MTDNVDIVRNGYADFLSGNIPGVLERFADEFSFSVTGAPEIPYAGTFRDKEALAGFFQQLNEQVNISVFEPREYFANGDRIVTLGHYGGEVRKNGQPFAADWAMAWTVRDGKIVAMEEMVDPSALKRAFSA